MKINLSRPKNEQHVQFHESVITLITKTGIENIPFKPLFELYKTAFDNESEALLIITKSELTAQISEQDRVRDAIFRGFSDSVKGFRNHFDPDKRNAANVLWTLFLHYGNLAQKTLDQETAAVKDFIREFQRPEISSAATQLNVNTWVERLELENNNFHNLMMARYSEVNNKTAFRMKSARVETDKYYRAIVAFLENETLIGNLNPTLNNFITELNAIVTRFKNIMAQEMGRRNLIRN